MSQIQERLARDADRARRLLTGVNDPRSIRALSELADLAERQLAEERSRLAPNAAR